MVCVFDLNAGQGKITRLFISFGGRVNQLIDQATGQIRKRTGGIARLNDH